MSKFNTTCNTKVSFTIGEVRHVLSIEDVRTLIFELQDSMGKSERKFRSLGEQTTDVMEDEECLYVMVRGMYVKRTIQVLKSFAHFCVEDPFKYKQFNEYNGHPMFKNLSDAQEYTDCLNDISRAERMRDLWIPNEYGMNDLPNLEVRRRSIARRGITITI